VMQTKVTAGKTLKRAGATPPCRRIAARSLRASGVTPASGCWNPQPVFWPRGGGAKQRSCKTARSTKPQGGIKGKHGNH
jgi:hypothetical protein